MFGLPPTVLYELVANIQEEEDFTENSRWPVFLEEFEYLATLGLCSCLATIDYPPLAWFCSPVCLPSLLPAWSLQAFAQAILEYGFKTQQAAHKS